MQDARSFGRWATLLAGLVSGLICLGIALTGGNEFVWLWVPTTAVAYPSAVLAWRVCAWRATAPSFVRGVLAGVVTVCVTQYAALWLFISGVWLSTRLGDVVDASNVMNPLEALAGAFVFGLWALFLTGWATVPAGVALGVWWTYRMRTAARVPVRSATEGS